MNKEITPKDALRRISGFISFGCYEYFDKELEKDWKKDIDAITQALDRLELLEKENQELENKNATLKIKVRAWEIQGKKYKKAIEIIKNKRVDFDVFMNCRDLEEYNGAIEYTYISLSENYTLTQQEYDLIKEVLE